MSGVQNVGAVDTGAYNNYKSSSARKFMETKKEDTAASADKNAAEGVVYEKSEAAIPAGSTSKIYTQNAGLVAQLKAEQDARTEDLKNIAMQMISGQGQAYGQANDIWSLFANGDFSNVSEAAKAQAQKDIAEGGYYSVDETSKRILDFAKALTGGDPEMAEKMRDAFKKGFEEATKSWGKELPEISSKTYDAVMEGFDDWKKEAAAN